MSGQVDAFTIYPCVDNTNPPCDGTDDVRVRGVDQTAGTARILRAGGVLINIGDATGRAYDGSMHNSVLQSVNSADKVSWQTATDADPDFVGTRRGVKIGFTRAPFNKDLTNWATMGVTFTVAGADGNPPGALHLRLAINGQIVAGLALDSGNSWTRSVGPFNLTSPQNATSNWFVEFEKLGVYTMELSAEVTHATDPGDCDTDSDDVNDAFCASETYTFVVGPISDLAVEDGGASSFVAADRNALTVVAVNNGPSFPTAARVTGLPNGAVVLYVSEGSYDSVAGVWDIDELRPRDWYRSAGRPEPTLVLDAAAGDTATVSIASTEDYEVCVGPKSDPGDLSHTTKAACEAVANASWNSTPVYDYITANDTATVTAARGRGGVGPGVPSGSRVTTGVTAVMWDAVSYLYGVPVLRYEVQRLDGSSWISLDDEATGNVFVDTAPGAGRDYRVRAVNVGGRGWPLVAEHRCGAGGQSPARRST